MQTIAAAIEEGAKAFMDRQYKTVAITALILALVLYLVFSEIKHNHWYGTYVSAGFLLGAFLSGLTGYIGMFVSVRANVRTAEAAKNGMAAVVKEGKWVRASRVLLNPVTAIWPGTSTPRRASSAIAPRAS